MGLGGYFTDAYIGLGTNIEDRRNNLNQALELLGNHARIHRVARSGIYETEPWGERNQSPCLNQVAHIRTSLNPYNLLCELHRIEDDLGRIRGVRWGTRRIDLDILLYGHMHVKDVGLQIPHPELKNRKFVLTPLAEIAGDCFVAAFGGTVNELLDACSDTSWVRILRMD